MIFSIGNHKPQIHPSAFVHPSAEISGKVIVGRNVSIWGGCVLRGDVDWIEIGDESNIQDLSVLHTSIGMPVKLGKGVTVGHRAIIHGATVGNLSLIGMGAVLLDRCVVEDRCLIGAGALVKEKGLIPAGQLAFGSPAKVMRPLTSSELQLIENRAQEYIQLASQYKSALHAANLL